MTRIGHGVLVAMFFGAASLSAQWPQWRGPNRDGIVAAANVPASWPEKPVVQWMVKTGEGYSTPVVADGRIFVHSRQEPDEIVTALDLSSGKQLWTARYRSSFIKNKYANEMSKGPFSTPLVANGIVYTLGTSAVLSAFDAATGAVVAEGLVEGNLFTGTAMSPIIDGGLLVVHVGDDGEGAFRAFDTRLNRPVALKAIRESEPGNAQRRGHASGPARCGQRETTDRKT